MLQEIVLAVVVMSAVGDLAQPPVARHPRVIEWLAPLVDADYDFVHLSTESIRYDSCTTTDVDLTGLIVNASATMGLQADLASATVDNDVVTLLTTGEPHTYVWLVDRSRGLVCHPIYTGSYDYAVRTFWISDTEFVALGFSALGLSSGARTPSILLWHVLVHPDTLTTQVHQIAADEVRVTLRIP